jgi:H+/gluconate symporter-like permease
MPLETLYHLLLLFGAMALLMYLVIRGRSIFIAAPLSAALAATLAGLNPVAVMTGPYMAGFAEYVANFFFVFTLGASFGKLYEQSGAAATLAEAVGRRLGRERACLAVVFSCAVLTYGGVSLFVVGFSVFPLAAQLFRAADLPRRFIPASIAFGSVTFTMTVAGSPEIQNLIPIKYLIDANTGVPLTDARAGWPVSIIVAATMFGLGQFYLNRAIRRAVAGGERWEDRPGDAARFKTSEQDRPSLLSAALPLVVTLLALNVVPGVCHVCAGRWRLGTSPPMWLERGHAMLAGFPEDPALAIFLGVVAALIVLRRQLSDPWGFLGEGFVNGLVAIGATSAVVGYGRVMQQLPAFELIVDWVTRIPGDPLIGAAVAIAVISAIAGSASGGQGIAWPIIKPIYVDQLGVAARALHRVVAISSGTLDSLPANGYVVMLIRNVCGETHQRAYFPLFVTTVLVPLLGTVLAIALFKLFPAWSHW